MIEAPTRLCVYGIMANPTALPPQGTVQRLGHETVSETTGPVSFGRRIVPWGGFCDWSKQDPGDTKCRPGWDQQKQWPRPLDIGPDITPYAATTGKGYDSEKNRVVCRERHVAPIIPHRSNPKSRPSFFPKLLYKSRARIDQAVAK
jgi:hypothetical protein